MLHIPQRNVTTVVSGDRTTIACAIGDELVITTREKAKAQKRQPRPSWLAIGTGMETRNFKSYPYEMTLLDLNANEAKMFMLIRQAYNTDTGLSGVSLSTYTPAQRTELSKGYKALEQRELVKRVKPKIYMINPLAIVNLNLFDELYEQWQKL